MPGNALVHPRIYDRLRVLLEGRLPGVSDYPSGFDISCQVNGQNVDDALKDSSDVIGSILGALELPESALVYNDIYDDQTDQIFVVKAKE